jgi:hypothetical protein
MGVARKCKAGRELERALQEEGRHFEANVVAELVRSLEQSSRLNSQVTERLRALGEPAFGTYTRGGR